LSSDDVDRLESESEGVAHALPLDDGLFQEPLYVTHAGWERVGPRQSYPRPGHASCYRYTWHEGRVLGEFLISMIVDGCGELETRQGLQPLQTGDCFVYMPGEWHRHRPSLSTGWTNLWFNFNGNLPHRWQADKAFCLDRNIAVVTDRRLYERQFRRLINSIDAAPARNSLHFSWQAIGLLSHLLREPVAEAKPRAPITDDPVVDAAIDFIWNHSHDQIGVPDVARHSGVGRRTLERRFKAATGDTPLNEILRCRISRAALLLRETDAPIKYIIGQAGFASYQQQRNAFQRHFGVSPETYRQQGGAIAVNRPRSGF
jgi:AraC-like DNA-binding protein